MVYVNDSATDGDLASSKPALTDLTKLVTGETLQKLQDRFSALGKVTVCICTVNAELITRPTWGSRFSKSIGTSARGRAAFTESIRTCAQDPTAKVPSICHEGMTFYATPIIHNGHQLATIVVGTRAARPLERDAVHALAARYDIDPDELWESASQIDPYHDGTREAIHRFADVLAETIGLLYGQADRIERQLADLGTVHGLAELLAGTQDLQEILDLTVQRVVEVMPVKACAIRLLNEDTGELVVKAVHNLSEEYLRKGPVMLHGNAINAAAFAGQAVYIEDAPTDPRIRYPQNARREGIVSGLCVPMTYRGQTVGVLRVYTGRRYKFSQSEESLLRSISSHAAAAIITGRLHREQAEAERFQRQVKAAGEIQQRMLPSQPPQHAGLEFGCVYDPTLQVGGDFYDFIELPGGRLGVCIADVVGKGLPAALLMASVRSALRANAYRPDRSGRMDEVDDVVTKVNQHMYRDTLVSEFATLVYGVFSADGRTFTYCNAGHNPPLLLRDERFLELTTGGLVIGVEPETTFEREVVACQPGDILTMITDGVTEAMSFEGTGYGHDRLQLSIRKHQSLDAGQLAQQMLWDVRRFAGLADQSDDITILVVKAR